MSQLSNQPSYIIHINYVINAKHVICPNYVMNPIMQCLNFVINPNYAMCHNYVINLSYAMSQLSYKPHM